VADEDGHLGPFETIDDAVAGLREAFNAEAQLLAIHDGHAAVVTDLRGRGKPDLRTLITLLDFTPESGWMSWSTSSSTGWTPYPDDSGCGVSFKNAGRELPNHRQERDHTGKPGNAILVDGLLVSVTWDVS